METVKWMFENMNGEYGSIIIFIGFLIGFFKIMHFGVTRYMKFDTVRYNQLSESISDLAESVQKLVECTSTLAAESRVMKEDIRFLKEKTFR